MLMNLRMTTSMRHLSEYKIIQFKIVLSFKIDFFRDIMIHCVDT
jgi:hypothetical protein